MERVSTISSSNMAQDQLHSPIERNAGQPTAPDPFILVPRAYIGQEPDSQDCVWVTRCSNPWQEAVLRHETLVTETLALWRPFA